MAASISSQAENQVQSIPFQTYWKDIEPDIVDIRHQIHAHPELSNREFGTAKLVAGKLKTLGYLIQTGVGKTGIVATLKGRAPGNIIAIRADMDALPVTENTNLPF